MRAVSTFDLRANLSRFLEKVIVSETPLVVRRFGKPIVVISPYPDTRLPSVSYYGFLGKGEKGASLVKRVRRSAREKEYARRLRGTL